MYPFSFREPRKETNKFLHNTAVFRLLFIYYQSTISYFLKYLPSKGFTEVHESEPTFRRFSSLLLPIIWKFHYAFDGLPIMQAHNSQTFSTQRAPISTSFHLPTHITIYQTSSLPELIPVLNNTIFTSLSDQNLSLVPHLSHSPACTKSVPYAHPHNVPCGNLIPSSKFAFISIYLIMSFFYNVFYACLLLSFFLLTRPSLLKSKMHIIIQTPGIHISPPK